jgi:hypothetical protein
MEENVVNLRADWDGLRDIVEEGQRCRSHSGDLQIRSLKHNSPNFALKLTVEAIILLR